MTLRGFSREPGVELARPGARVNALFPGPVNTPPLVDGGISQACTTPE